MLFRGLLMVDSELNVVPAMADNFRVSSDGLTYLFRIKEDARWSDGEPLTADDYAFAWMRMRELGTRTAFLMEDVETAEALDDRRSRQPASRGATSRTCSAPPGPFRGRATSASRSATTGPSRRTSSATGRSCSSSTTRNTPCRRTRTGGPRERERDPLLVLSEGLAHGRGVEAGRFDLLHVYDPVPRTSR